MSAANAPALRVAGLSVRLPGQAAPLLSDLGLEVRHGETVGVLGLSGCGKSTLLHAVAGLLPWARPAEMGGAIAVNGEDVTELDPGQRAHLIGTCLDRPDAQLFLGTVRQELEAARSLHGDPPLAARVAEVLGLGAVLERRVTELSSGERQRLALAVTLAGAPHPALLDEPTVHLDDDGVAALVEVLGEIRRVGGCVLLTEQAGFRLAGAVGRWLRLDGGALRPAPAPEPPVLRRPAGIPGGVVLEAEDVRLVRGGRTLLEHVGMCVRAGEVVLLSGPNGAGKSSLARALAGHAPAAGGGLTIAAGRVQRTRGTALLLPDAGVQLFAATVADEIALAGLDAPGAAAVLRRHRLERLGGRAPWTLSRGEQQRLAHAAVDALEPAVTVIDEPGQGLGPVELATMSASVAERAEAGSAYLIVSQRPELVGLANRHLSIVGGTVVELGGGR
jgi:energy-coupling factor transporter ATP-binding protein EcfA2